MPARRSTVRKRRVPVSDKGAPSAGDTAIGPRLEAVEQEIADLRTVLEAQGKRIQTIQAQLDHLTARGPI